LLTAEEAAWIIHYSEVTTKITARVQLNPRHPKLNVVEPPMRKVESKIGRVYNNWKIVALKGEDENTANHAKVMYEFACQTCGHLVECAYNNIHKKVCMECKRKARETTEIPEKLLRGVQSQWVIYLLENGGWQLSSRGLQPANATKKAFLTHRDTPMAWLDLNAKCSDHFQREAEEEEQEEPTPEHLIREIQDIPDIPDPMDL
jgi:ribosome-associated toxin RatA of RatAB toxin-antitoxin module